MIDFPTGELADALAAAREAVATAGNLTGAQGIWMAEKIADRRAEINHRSSPERL